MLTTLTHRLSSQGLKPRFSSPPARQSSQELAQVDRVDISSAFQDGRESTAAKPSLEKALKMGFLSALSLSGGLVGVAHADQAVVELEHQQQAVSSQDLLDPAMEQKHRERLIEQMEVLNPEIVEALVGSGLRVAVAGNAKELRATGALQLTTPEVFQAHAEGDVEKIATETLGAQGAGTLDRSVRKFTQERWLVYRPQKRDKDEETSTAEMAKDHGFKTEEDIAWFSAQVEAANPERLKVARQDTLNKASHESALGGRKGRKAAKRLEEYQKDPNAIPIRVDEHPVVVPNYHTFKVYGDRVYGTLHDKKTFDVWRSRDSKLGGLYFGEGDKHVVVMTPFGLRSDDTIIHEFGHALERMVERTRPEEFADFKVRLKSAHDGVKPSGNGIKMDPDGGKHHDHSGRKQISDYSRTNHREYLAEGYAHYIENPGKLQKQDPLLFQLIEELIDLLNHKNTDPKPDLDLSVDGSIGWLGAPEVEPHRH